jgi:hypothetical protein
LRCDWGFSLVQSLLPSLNLIARIAPGIIQDDESIIGATAPLDAHPAILDASAGIKAESDIVGARFLPIPKFASIVLEAP